MIETLPDEGMTVDSLLDQLALVQHKEWTIKKGLIRTRKGQCPLCALWSELTPKGNGFLNIPLTSFENCFGEALRVPSRSAVISIMDAADDPDSPHRRNLLDALGLDPTY